VAAPHAREPRRAPVEEVPLDAEALEAIRARAEELVRELLAKMGFAAEVSSSIDEAAGEAVVSVRSESEGLLIGRRGQTLDSLEHIVNRMTLRADAYVEGRVLLDIGDYRKRRRESLDELAGRLRARAVGERRTVQVSPMSPRDRKFFAQAFADDDSVEVRALGAGFYRRVIVAPAGASAASIAEAASAGDVDDESSEHESFSEAATDVRSEAPGETPGEPSSERAHEASSEADS
jgi:spoIIIJ-associated protein